MLCWPTASFSYACKLNWFVALLLLVLGDSAVVDLQVDLRDYYELRGDAHDHDSVVWYRFGSGEVLRTYYRRDGGSKVVWLFDPFESMLRPSQFIGDHRSHQ